MDQSLHWHDSRRRLKASEERIRFLFDAVPHALYECNTNGIITFTNAAYSRITGYSHDELVGMPIQKLMATGPQKDDLASYFQHLAKERPSPTPYRAKNLTQDGRTIDVEVNWNYMCNEQDHVVGFVCILSDITDRTQAEQTLQENEERFRVLSEAAFEGIVFSEKGVLFDANRAFLDIYGYEYEEAVGKPVISFVAPQDRDLVFHRIQSNSEGIYEHKGLHKNGQIIDLEVHGRSVSHQGREMRMTAVRDITERKRAETKLLEYQRQLKSLTSQLTLAEEQEKRRLAEQLHDNVGQCLAFCKMKLQLTLKSVPEQTTVDELDTVCEMLTQAMDHIKNVTYGLRSPVLKELGFEKAVSVWLQDDIERQHDVKTEFILDGQASPMDENLKTILFRSVRELVTNSIKHAKPDNIRVYVDRQKGDFSVCVEDDGHGFDPEATESGSQSGFGLFSIRERLDYWGGCLNLTTSPGHGCKAVIKVPLHQKGVTEVVYALDKP